MIKIPLAIACFIISSALPYTSTAQTISLAPKIPCNLFPSDAPVEMAALVQGWPAGKGEAVVTLKDYFDHSQTIRVPVDYPGGSTPIPLPLGRLDAGYYEVSLSLSISSPAGQTTVKSTAGPTSIGVASLGKRTAEEALNEGRRFGLKIFQVGKPGVWWRKGLVWDIGEVVDATSALELHWTRHQFNQKAEPGEAGIISTPDLVAKNSMIVIHKIEGFPKTCYDEKRYGPSEKKKFWNKRSVPLKEPYQKWLREELAKLPPDQRYFEIWNEPDMSQEEFAEICQMVAPIVREYRQDAIIMPNVHTDRAGWDEWLAAGGAEGVNAIAHHPYSFTPMPEYRTRAYFRNHDDFLVERTGRHYDAYVTEYGWSSSPEMKKWPIVNERGQAQRTTRQSLIMYAEGIKALVPHWMADREQDPKDPENWFGFFRLNRQPKPVLIAHATCARMIDGGRFVGDLWFGPGVGALLFERAGIYTAALWTLDEAPGTGVDLTLPIGAPEINVINMMGAEQRMKTADGALKLKVSSDVTYLVDLPAAWKDKVVPADMGIDDARWATRADAFAATRFTPVIDGRFNEWAKVKPTAITKATASNQLAGGSVRFAWDATRLYIGFEVEDDVIFNDTNWATRKPASAPRGDQVTIDLCARPDRQLTLDKWTIYDYTLIVAPTSSDGKPALVLTNPVFLKTPLINPAPNDPCGIRWQVARTASGWAGEVSIPFTVLKAARAPIPGTKFTATVSIADGDHAGNALVTSPYPDKPSSWPYLLLSP